MRKDRDRFAEGISQHHPMGAIYDETPPAAMSEQRSAALRMTAYRALHVTLYDASGNPISTTNPMIVTHGKTLKPKSGTVSSSGNNTILAAVTGKKITVYAVKLVAVTTTALTAIWQDGAGGTEIWRDFIQTPANVSGGANLAVTPPGFLFQGSANTLLNLNLSSAVSVHYAISYWEE